MYNTNVLEKVFFSCFPCPTATQDMQVVAEPPTKFVFCVSNETDFIVRCWLAVPLQILLV